MRRVRGVRTPVAPSPPQRRTRRLRRVVRGEPCLNLPAEVEAALAALAARQQTTTRPVLDGGLRNTKKLGNVSCAHHIGASKRTSDRLHDQPMPPNQPPSARCRRERAMGPTARQRSKTGSLAIERDARREGGARFASPQKGTRNARSRRRSAWVMPATRACSPIVRGIAAAPTALNDRSAWSETRPPHRAADAGTERPDLGRRHRSPGARGSWTRGAPQRRPRV